MLLIQLLQGRSDAKGGQDFHPPHSIRVGQPTNTQHAWTHNHAGAEDERKRHQEHTSAPPGVDWLAKWLQQRHHSGGRSKW